MTKKSFKKQIVALFLASVAAFSCLTACGKSGETDNTPDKPDNDNTDIVVETDGFIVKDGKSDYKILMDAEPSQEELVAESELIDIFEQATGITLQVVTDDRENLSSESKYLSIGDNELLKATEADVSYDVLGEDGFRIFTKDNTVFMCGGGDMGTLYAVYEFLNKTLDFEVFGTNGMRLSTNVKELKLFEYDVKQIPSFQKRTVGSGLVYEAAGVQRRLRLQTTGTYLGSVNGVQVHNSLAYLPPEKYKDHGDWYSASKGELCYTAHGNPTEYALMAQAAADVIKETIIKDDVYMLTLTQQDNTVFCGCGACIKEETKYGAKSGAIVKFANQVHRRVMEWMNTEEGLPYKRDFRLYFFAYQDSLDAPVKYDSKGNISPVDNDVICDDGVGVYFAPMELDYERSVYDDVNSNFLAAFSEWKVLAKDMIMWSYGTNFNYYLIPYDCFEYMQEFFQLAKNTGVRTIYHQHQNNQLSGATGWHNLKIYLSAKLMWNVDADVGALTEDFFKTYYGPVSDEMLELYTQYRTHSAVIKKNTEGKTSTIYSNRLKEEYWQRQMLIDWKNRISQLLGKLESLKKQNKTEYERIYKNVASEGVAYNYLLIEVYGNTFSQAELRELKTELRDYLTVSGITKLDLLTQITNYYESLKD